VPIRPFYGGCRDPKLAGFFDGVRPGGPQKALAPTTSRCDRSIKLIWRRFFRGTIQRSIPSPSSTFSAIHAFSNIRALVHCQEIFTRNTYLSPHSPCLTARLKPLPTSTFDETNASTLPFAGIASTPSSPMRSSSISAIPRARIVCRPVLRSRYSR
jgi:hypothetical protein